MSVVVWDGKIVAADRMAIVGGVKVRCNKIQVIGRNLHTYTGDLAHGPRLSQWYEAGAKPEAFPDLPSEDDDFARLVVIDTGGKILSFEYRPSPDTWETSVPMAWGAGRDFAIAAMAMGADAIRAVEVTNDHSASCGMGVEAWQAVRGKWKCVF